MSPDKLIQGKTYFLCGYSLPQYPVPEITTLIYLGKNLLPDKEDPSKDEYIFQDPQKYYGEEMKKSLTDDEYQAMADLEYSGKYTLYDDSLHMVKDIDELIAWLTSLKKDNYADELL